MTSIHKRDVFTVNVRAPGPHAAIYFGCSANIPQLISNVVEANQLQQSTPAKVKALLFVRDAELNDYGAVNESAVLKRVAKVRNYWGISRRPWSDLLPKSSCRILIEQSIKKSGPGNEKKSRSGQH